MVIKVLKASVYSATHTHTVAAAKTRRLKSVSHGVRSFVQNGRGKIAPTDQEEEGTLPQKRCDAYMGNDGNSSIYGWHPFRHNANAHTSRPFKYFSGAILLENEFKNLFIRF